MVYCVRLHTCLPACLHPALVRSFVSIRSLARSFVRS